MGGGSFPFVGDEATKVPSPPALEAETAAEAQSLPTLASDLSLAGDITLIEASLSLLV